MQKTFVKTIRQFFGFLTFSLAIIIFSSNFCLANLSSNAGNSDGVDPDFNVKIQTNSYSSKSVTDIKVLPDDKMLVTGSFNSFNGQPVGGFVRLNADGTLDATFKNNLFVPIYAPTRILLLSSGKILVSGLRLVLDGQTEPTKSVLRLNADGTIDPTFDYTLNNAPSRLTVDSSGRIYLSGAFEVTEDGVTVTRFLIRINDDGSYDSSFKFQSIKFVDGLAAQGDKIIVGRQESSSLSIIYRVNSDGSDDNSFPAADVGNLAIRAIVVQPDDKILVFNERKLFRLNKDGGNDAGFQIVNFARPAKGINLNSDGKITFSYGNSSAEGFTFVRVLPNGTPDPSFTTYIYKDNVPGAQAVQSDGSIIIADTNPGFSLPKSSDFVRVLPTGTVDSTFNDGGYGFTTTNPGSIRSIVVQPDGKIILGGNFDKVGEVFRSKIARLNSDGTLDETFIANAANSGNYFTQFNEIYNIRLQSDGKMIVTGGFNYVVNGVQKSNIVRLNADGSIDGLFVPSIIITDFFASTGGGSNRFIIQNDNKIVAGLSKSGNTYSFAVRFKSDGNLDNTFNPTVLASINTIFSLDAALQPDGKILIGGRYYAPISNDTVLTSFLVRLNPDGSADQTFQMPEEANRDVSTFKLLPNGKILLAKSKFVNYQIVGSSIHRLNSDGSVDSSFNVSTVNGKSYALLSLPDGKILVGGKFTAVNNQPHTNLVKLNEDGSLDSTNYTVNQEVLCLTLDNEQRVLVGGNFTTIGVGGESTQRSFAARLISASQSSRRTRFDFDGDGQADLATFTPTSGNWSIFRSQNKQSQTTQFGAVNDKTTAADFDGDGKTDLAVYRPSEGVWYLSQSTDGFTAIRWGAAEDKPVPADYDGDGKADIAVWRPSNGVWYILQSSNNRMKAVQFGTSTDIVLTDADFDGDGRADIAVWRPSNGVFYWLESESNDKFRAVQFGQQDDIPAIADYNGDGKADLVVFRPSDGVWYQFLTNSGGNYTFTARQFGQNGDQPVAADYDGDGKTDIAVRRQGIWYILKSVQGFSGVSFGNADTKAVAALQN